MLTPKKPGGLFYNDKRAFVDSTLQANQSLDWVQRLREHNTPRIMVPGEDRPSTHRMGDDGQGYVFPTIVRQPGQQKLTNLDREGEDYARQTGTGIQFKKKEQGDWFASHKNGPGSYGGYKQGTGVLQGFAKGGLLPTKLTMLGPDGKPQMELGGGNRIFSRANTRELVIRSQSAKTPAELKELGGRIKAMLDQQDRNKPEYVKD